MRHLITQFIAIVVASSFSFAQNTTQSQTLTLRITSSTDEPVSFIVSSFFKAKTIQLNSTIQQTPYELTVESNYVNATIIKTCGHGDLVVDLKRASNVGNQPNLKAISSSVVVVGTVNAQTGTYYQQTF